jgi:subtilisin family serine protease
LVVAATSENAKEISMYKGVKSIRKEYKYQISLDDSVPLTNADETWLRLDSEGQSVTGAGIKIAIIDTGIDYSHSALGTCMGVKCKVLGGYDFVNDDDDPMDDHGHGTHVAGIAAANSEQIKGVAPDALLYAYKSLDSNGSGWETDIIAAIEAAADPDGNPLTDDAVDIINMSLGGIDNGSSLMDEAVKKVVAMGVTVVVAAGNDGIAPNFSINRNSLANEPSVITVGATTKQDRIAYFSSIGHAETTTHLKPEISAPGSSILSTVLGNNLEEKKRNEYGCASCCWCCGPHITISSRYQP